MTKRNQSLIQGHPWLRFKIESLPAKVMILLIFFFPSNYDPEIILV